MKVKICGEIFDSEVQPIVLFLSKEERDLIGSMADDATTFCSYPDGTNEEFIKELMKH